MCKFAYLHSNVEQVYKTHPNKFCAQVYKYMYIWKSPYGFCLYTAQKLLYNW